MKTPTAYDWLTAEDVVRHALAAYYLACRHNDAAEAEELAANPCHERGNPLGRPELADHISEILGYRLHQAGEAKALPHFNSQAKHVLASHVEYVDNFRKNISKIPSKTNIHCRASQNENG